MTLFYFFTVLVLVFLSNLCSICGDISVCLEGDFYCRTSKQCIPLKLRCDGASDCYFGEDEKGCSCVSWCDKNRRCVLRRERCNGVFDCLDLSDEQNCTEINCGHDRFICLVNGTSQCLDVSLRCDFQTDCDDGSDESSCADHVASGLAAKMEEGCDGKPFCPVKPAQINSTDCPLSSRLASTFRLEFNKVVRKCDTIPDCPLGEDELNCAESVNCLPENGLFLCANGRECLPFARVCDGFAQCSDGSDEFVSNCLRKFNDGQQEPDAYLEDDKCPFRCQLPSLNSTTTREKAALTLPYSRFCILLEQVCDGKEDCPFGDDEDRFAHGCQASDEMRYASQKCGGLSVLQCDPESTDCVVTPAFGPTCICKPGFRPSKESVTSCVDIDECSFGACEHFCENLLGSFECGCRDGYHLAPGSCQHCEAVSVDEEPYFIFSTPSLIYRYDKASQMTRLNLYHADPSKARPTWSGPIPFDYGRNDDLLIFYNWGAIRAKIGHDDVEPWVLLNVDHDVTWLAYDDLNNNVYFNGVDAKEGGYFWRVFYVGIFREKGRVTNPTRSTGVKTVVRDKTNGVTSSNLALFPEMGIMFFTASQSGRDWLLHSALNGDNLKPMDWSFERIRSLGVDRSNNYLYIFDAGRPGLAQVPIIAKTSPATVGDLSWIEERRSFFGPEPFVFFSAGQYDSGLYLLAGEVSYDGLFKTSFQAINKSSLMVFEASIASPFSLIASGSLLLNTSFFRVRPTAPSLQLDVCFHERQRACDMKHICLAKPPASGETSAFTRAVCDCPDPEWSPGCEPKDVPIRRDFWPPGRPIGSRDEFRERLECANFVYLPQQQGKKRDNGRNVADSKSDDEVLGLGTWPNNVTGALDDQQIFGGNNYYDALHSSSFKVVKNSALTIAYLCLVLSFIF